MSRPKLASNRSPRWAFMQKFEVPDYDEPERNYLTRWRLIQTPWFGIYLHKLDGPDPRPTLHDHPWGFLSLILRGGYAEWRLDPNTGDEVRREHRWLNRLRAFDAHSIVHLFRVPTWTLMFVGARRRRWGYVEPVGEGRHIWTAFDLHSHNDEFLAAMDRRKWAKR